MDEHYQRRGDIGKAPSYTANRVCRRTASSAIDDPPAKVQSWDWSFLSMGKPVDHILPDSAPDGGAHGLPELCGA